MGQTLNIREEFCRHRYEETVADLEPKYSPEDHDNSIQTVGQNENEESKEDYKRENEEFKEDEETKYDISSGNGIEMEQENQEFCRHRYEETVADLEAKYSPEYHDNSIQTVGQNENEESKEDYEAKYAEEYIYDILEQSKDENQDEDDEIENEADAYENIYKVIIQRLQGTLCNNLRQIKIKLCNKTYVDYIQCVET